MGREDGGAPCTWWYTSKLNFYVKIETMCLLFLVESLFNHQTSAPPHPPPHDTSNKMSKYDMWPSTRIKNHVSSISICVCMPANVLLCDFELFWEFEIHQKSCPNNKNRWFFVITFNATVRSPHMWYQSNFFSAKQIPHKIYEKSMIHYGGAPLFDA